jgi:flavin-dependent dehydrogenase
METFDVVVIGAGLAGLEISRTLSGYGLSVLLADRKTALEKPIHTTGIFVRRTLEDFDLPLDCLGAVVRNVKLYAPSGKSLELESPHAEYRVGNMAKLYGRLLKEAQKSGAVFSNATHFRGSSKAIHGSVVHLLRQGKDFSVKAQLIVGADGANSKVAEDLKLERNKIFLVGVEDVLQSVPQIGKPCFHVFLDPKIAPGYIAWLVNDGQHVHLGTGGDAGHFDAVQALEAFKHRLNSKFDFSNATLLERRGGRIPVGGMLKNIANTKGLLIGDAAGAVSPLTAGGLDPAIRISRYAAKVIHQALQVKDLSLLETYNNNRWQKSFQTRLWMRALLSSVHNPAWLELGVSAANLPGFKTIAWNMFFGRGTAISSEPSYPNARSSRLKP